MDKNELNGLVVRLLVTFVQGFVAAWTATGFKTDKLALGGAAAAALSVVYNLIIKPKLEELTAVKGA